MPDLLTVAALLGVGLAAGFMAGLLGIGGGLLLVPAMVLFFGFDQHVAQGTSLLVIIPAALAGSWTHHRKGRLVLRDAVAAGAGGVLGAAVGAFLALGIDDIALRRLFALLLLASALRIFFRSAADPSIDAAADRE
jgi:uncharacterized protein